jgi:hypothetical protein
MNPSVFAATHLDIEPKQSDVHIFSVIYGLDLE